jgi:cytidylate kinase
MAVIVISSKIGSFGEEIAALAAEKLGYRLVTPDTIHKMGLECDPKFREACSVFETEVPPGMLGRLFFREPAYTSLFESLNYQIAAEGNVVILGCRGTQIVLRGRPGVLKVRVVAPEELRIKRLGERPGGLAGESIELLFRHEKRQRSLIESVFGVDLADWSLYDLVLNTAGIGKEKGADLVAYAVGLIEAPDWAECRLTFERMAFAKRVESAIKHGLPAGPFRALTVTSPDGATVVLTGYVQDKRSRETAGRLASEQTGVAAVDNRLKTTELSF